MVIACLHVIPQIIKCLRTKSSKDLSYFSITILFMTNMILEKHIITSLINTSLILSLLIIKCHNDFRNYVLSL